MFFVKLENQNTSELHRDQACIEKINAISTQLSAREHDLQEARMVNANLRRMSSEQQELFDDEKRKIIECHEGERKNWIKAKQVMLDKIQTVRERICETFSGWCNALLIVSIIVQEQSDSSRGDYDGCFFSQR